MDQWDVILVIAGGYVAVTALVRLMRAHRERMLADVRREVQRGGKTPNPDPQPGAGKPA
jgi:hypothetical protein